MVQSIGWAGMIMFLISYQLKSNKMLYLFQSLGAGLFCLQFLLMGAYSGCFSLLFILIRGIMLRGYTKDKWIRSKVWPALFIAAFTVIMIETWAGPVSILSYIASVVSTVFYWSNNAGKIRIANLCCCSPCWIVYDIIIGSWGGVGNEALTMISILISIIRFGWKSLFDENSEFQK